MHDLWFGHWYWWGFSDGGDCGIVVVVMVVLAVVRVANVNIVGLLYLSVCLVVGMVVVVVLMEMGEGWWWCLVGIGGDGGLVMVVICFKGGSCNKVLFICILCGGICGLGGGVLKMVV